MNKMSKKFISLIVTLFMVFGMIPAYATESTLSGSGTGNEPYLIETEADLIAFRDMVHEDAITKANESENGIGVSTLCAKLTSDITLTPGWTGMGYRGNKQYRYGGVFDGNGHTISNMTAGRVEICGLVGESGTGLTIKNLTIEGAMEIPEGAETLYYSGGFVGRANDAVTFINCNNKVNITGTGDYLGGFIGYTDNYNHSFENCANYGNITATNGTASGFVYNLFGGKPTFKNCANYGSVSGVGQWSILAGIAAFGEFENCIGYGSVTNTTGPATVIYNANESTNTQTNCYYRSDAVTSGTGVTPNGGTAASADQFASGEIAYLLNGSSSENVTWGQELGADTYPVYGKIDYPVYNVDGYYSNKNERLGSENNPYLIGTEADLIAFRDAVNADAAANMLDGVGVSKLCAKLTSDITLTSGWTGMGLVWQGKHLYGGIFDGNGYAIKNMKSGNVETNGLVRESGAGLTIKNLTIEGTMEIPEGAETLYYSGGFVGRTHDAVTFINCTNKVDISGTGDYLGGFIGYTENYNHSFTNCANYGNISSTDGITSGFVCNAVHGGKPIFTNCANYGNITANKAWGQAAGIAAYGDFKNCIGYGSVINTSENGVATATYNGFVADNEAENIYFRTDVTSATTITNGGIGKTEEQFVSGEVAYLINFGANEIICGQKLGEMNYPVFDDANMIYYTSENDGYSNNNGVYLSADSKYVLLASTEKAKAFIAQYNEDNALVNVNTLNVKEELMKYTIVPASNAVSCKVMLWDSYLQISPLCDAISFSIETPSNLGVNLGNTVILGDSISTFQGYIPDGYEIWYLKGGRNETDVTDVEQTWWYQIMESSEDNELILNSSWSGSTICNTGYNGNDVSDWSFIARTDELIANGFFEENEVDTIVIFGGTNDTWAGSPIGSLQYSDWTNDDLKSALPAFCYMIDRLQKSTPDTRIICVLATTIGQSIKQGYVEACQHYNVESVPLTDIDLMEGHPTIKGMKQIKEQLIDALLE